ncbi:MAG: DMT family transporter [Bacteroidota bacterium]|nr:DMT family transporter [Bacteroidota bacterium]MDP4191269.1 DMT family transporter [Bacteroidota bacterium]MDP4194140.1 DMT family transporter [Bacteroidota bacterium]
MNQHNKAILYLIATALLWSLGGVLIKWVKLNPIAIAGMRSLISVIFIVVAFRPKVKFSSVKLAGGFAYAATVVLFVSANKLTTAANAILLQYTAPVYVAILGYWFLKERISKVDWISIFIAFCGMILFFLDKLSTGNMFGNVIAIFSGIAFAWLVLLMRKQKDESPLDSVIIGNILTALIGVPFVFGSHIDISSWIGLLLLGVVQLGIPYVLYAYAIRHVAAIEAILIPVIEPVLNPIWVLLILGESPGIYALIGGIIVIGSLTFRSIVQLWQNREVEQA